VKFVVNTRRKAKKKNFDELWSFLKKSKRTGERDLVRHAKHRLKVFIRAEKKR